MDEVTLGVNGQRKEIKDGTLHNPTIRNGEKRKNKERDHWGSEELSVCAVNWRECVEEEGRTNCDKGCWEVKYDDWELIFGYNKGINDFW